MKLRTDLSLSTNAPEIMTAQAVPHVTVQSQRTRGGSVWVVREDLLPGGTKQRGVLPFLRHLQDQGVQKITYASPFAGYAQIALASAAREVGIECELFCEVDRRPGRTGYHPYSKLAGGQGAVLRLCNHLDEAEAGATDSAKRQDTAYKIPLGLAHPVFYEMYERSLAEQWARVVDQVGTVDRLWISVGSGTLARAFLSFLPKSVSIVGVTVGVLPVEDSRIAELRAREGFTLFESEQPFIEEARVIPPFRSNPHYDAKLWARVSDECASGRDVFWNVAG